MKVFIALQIVLAIVATVMLTGCSINAGKVQRQRIIAQLAHLYILKGLVR